jgi:hypothetical protein
MEILHRYRPRLTICIDRPLSPGQVARQPIEIWTRLAAYFTLGHDSPRAVLDRHRHPADWVAILVSLSRSFDDTEPEDNRPWARKRLASRHESQIRKTKHGNRDIASFLKIEHNEIR